MPRIARQSRIALCLSTATDHVLVVGNRPSAVSATVNWLHNRGVSVVEMPGTWPMPTKQEMTDMANRLQARTIVWVEQTGDLRAPTVAVRGIETDSNVVLWSGQASATSYRSSPTGSRITWLTCHALRAAWGKNQTEIAANDVSPSQRPLGFLFTDRNSLDGRRRV